MKVKLIRGGGQKMHFKRFRGNAWFIDDRHTRCTGRYWLNPGFRYDDLVFLCCFSPFFVNDKRKVKQ